MRSDLFYLLDNILDNDKFFRNKKQVKDALLTLLGPQFEVDDYVPEFPACIYKVITFPKSYPAMYVNTKTFYSSSADMIDIVAPIWIDRYSIDEYLKRYTQTTSALLSRKIISNETYIRELNILFEFKELCIKAGTNDT